MPATETIYNSGTSSVRLSLDIDETSPTMTLKTLSNRDVAAVDLDATQVAAICAQMTWWLAQRALQVPKED